MTTYITENNLFCILNTKQRNLVISMGIIKGVTREKPLFNNFHFQFTRRVGGGGGGDLIKGL